MTPAHSEPGGLEGGAAARRRHWDDRRATTVERWLESIQLVTDRVEVIPIVVTNAPLSGASAFGGAHSAKVNLVASLGNDDQAITRRGCSAPGSE
jgi:hypothetical protein